MWRAFADCPGGRLRKQGVVSAEVAPADDADQSYVNRILADAPPLDDDQAVLIVEVLRDALLMRTTAGRRNRHGGRTTVVHPTGERRT
jgi:hypothetical protein